MWLFGHRNKTAFSGFQNHIALHTIVSNSVADPKERGFPNERACSASNKSLGLAHFQSHVVL